MKKRIRINENQLKELVEDVLNELDWRNEKGDFEPYHPHGDTPQYQNIRQKDGTYKLMRAPNPYEDVPFDCDDFHTRQEVWANNVTESVMRLLKEHSEYMDPFTELAYDKLNNCFALGGNGYDPQTQTLKLRTCTDGNFGMRLQTSFYIDGVAKFNFGEKGELPSVEFAITKMSPPQYARRVDKNQVVKELTELYRRADIFLLRALKRISKSNIDFPSLEELGLELPQ